MRTNGGRKLARFLKKHGISKSEAARSLHVTHVTIINWCTSRAVPEPERRPSIAIWTNGEVSEDDWVTEQEQARRDELATVVPFTGGDAA